MGNRAGTARPRGKPAGFKLPTSAELILYRNSSEAAAQTGEVFSQNTQQRRSTSHGLAALEGCAQNDCHTVFGCDQTTVGGRRYEKQVSEAEFASIAERNGPLDHLEDREFGQHISWARLIKNPAINALLAKREAAQAALGKAELDLSYCYVRAEFDALVVNLHTAIGQFVAPGPTPVFSLVDRRAWYVMANYRESELAHIAPGMEVELYVQTDPTYRFRGIVQGIGWAVNPEDQPIVAGVPKIERELNWVHIAQRFPVRIRIQNPDPPHVFRVGASAVAIIRGWPRDGVAGATD